MSLYINKKIIKIIIKKKIKKNTIQKKFKDKYRDKKVGPFLHYLLSEILILIKLSLYLNLYTL